MLIPHHKFIWADSNCLNQAYADYFVKDLISNYLIKNQTARICCLKKSLINNKNRQYFLMSIGKI